MTNESKDELAGLLDDGWEIAGYSVNMLAMGGNHHNILLRKGNALSNFSILLVNGSDKRGLIPLTPYEKSEQKKKGFFG